MALDSAWSYTTVTVTDPAPEVADSAWSYQTFSVSDPDPAVGSGDSAWSYQTVTIAAPGKPYLMVGGAAVETAWYKRTTGGQVPIIRWTVMQDGVEVPLITVESPVTSLPSYVVGADPIGTASYTIPPTGTVYYVATTGNDSNAGTSTGAPLATLTAALGKVIAGDTIVIRAGVYHEGGIEAGSKIGVTIQPYPGEAVWFDGSTVKTGWTDNGDGTWSAPYSIAYDRQLGKGSNVSVWSGAANRVIVDQVWLDSTKLTPAADNTTPGAGQFSVQRGSGTIRIGSNPTGKTARVVDLAYLIAINGATIRGIGVRRYAQAMLEWRGSALNLGAGSVIEQCIIEHCSIDAVSIGGAGSAIRRCTIQDTGHSGLMGDNMAGGMVERNIIRRCNRGDFDAEPSTAGFKMTRVFAGLTVRFNHIEDVADGAGIWFDTTVSRSKVYGNTIVGTSALGTTGYRMKNGIEIEGSDGGYYDGTQYWTYVVGNRVTDCRQAGILCYDSGYVKVWNNLASAAVAVYLWQDYRQNDGSKPSTEGTVTQSPWHTDHIELVNNAIVPEGAYYTQLRAQCNSDAAYKIAGGAMLTRIESNWFRPQGSGLMAYLSNAAGSAWSNRSTLSALGTTTSEYGGPLTSIMAGNYQGDAAPSSNGASIQSDVAAATGLPVGYVPPIGPIWPDLTLAG